jgi:hypothetical protein
MSLKPFDIQGDKVTFTPEFLAVPEFKALWNRDYSRGKRKATQELSYIVFLCDNTVSNPYRGYSEEIREEILREDFIGRKDWEPDEEIKAAIKKLEHLLETTSSRLLKSSRIAADKLGIYFETIDFSKVDENGKPIYSARELASNLSAVGNIIKSLKTLEDQVRKEQLDDNLARGGAEINPFEIPSETLINGGEEAE